MEFVVEFFYSMTNFVAFFSILQDVNDNEPIFVFSFYNVSVVENDAKGRCILNVSFFSFSILSNQREKIS